MLESCSHLRDQDPGALADLMTRFITDLRAVLVDPEARLPVKLAEIESIVDRAAPPPPPGGSLPARGPAG